MKVFVTGATGFIGSAVVAELLAAGHQVAGLARSDTGAAALAATGAEVVRGTLEDLDTLGSAAAASDGVIHTAFIHDFSNSAHSAAVDERAIETIGAALAGSGRPLIVSAGIAGLAPGRLLTENDAKSSPLQGRGRVSEESALALVPRGVRGMSMRLPPSVHGQGDHGFMAALIGIARERGVAAYPAEGANRWSSVHRRDAARLFRLALENAPAGTLLHAVADEGVTTRDIAAMIGKHLGLPVVSVPAEQAGEHFGWLGAFFGLDMAASSTITRERFNWQPTEASLLEDLEQGHYFG